MSEVKKWYIGVYGGEAQARPCSPAQFEIIRDRDRRYFVVEDDFDRVTAERDAALAENKLLRHDVASYLETVAKVCDMLGVDLESAKTAEGKPSDVLFGYVSSMQQRLTAADERVDVLEGFLSNAYETAAKWVEKRCDDYVNEHGSSDPETGAVEFPGDGEEYVGELMEIADGLRALKPAEGDSYE